MSGTLYVVATPIGNLGDMTYRAVEILRSVDMVACEDTRRTEKLMRHFEIRKPLLRYDEHTHKKMGPRLISALNEGKTVALVTDAGTPGVSDPGGRLVADALLESIQIQPIPGASAVTAAISVAGFGKEGYIFLGFLPPKKGKAKRVLQEAFGLGRKAVIFESPYRVESTLNMVMDVCPEAYVVLAREMTKIHEEFIRGDVKLVLNQLKRTQLKGEFVMVLGPPGRKKDGNNHEF